MIEKLIESLETLGIKGEVTTKKRDRWTLDVYVNGEWVGLWDIEKNTFVE